MPIARVVLLSLLIANAGTAGPVAAQTAPAGELSDSAVGRLIAKQKQIRIQIGSGNPVELKQPRIEGDMLVGQVGSYGSGRYPIRDFNEVWRRGSSPDIGFAIGAGIGFVAASAAATALSNSLCYGSCGDDGSGILVGGMIGAVTFGGVGALVGLGVERWRSVYRAERRRVTPVITKDLVGLRLNF